MCELTGYNMLEDKDLISRIVSETAADHFLSNSYDLEEILLDVEEEELLEIPGLGPKELEQIAAIKESVRRVLVKEREEVVTIGSPNAAVAYNRDMESMKVEEVRCLMLNTKNRVLGQRVISTGTISKSLVNPREFYSVPIRKMAAGCIFIHNHPSGVADPSEEDRDVTRKLREAGSTLGVELVDSIIVARGATTPSRRRGSCCGRFRQGGDDNSSWPKSSDNSD